MRTLKAVLGTAAVAVLCFGILLVGFREFYKAAYPRRFQQEVEAFSAQNGLEPSLVYAVIRTESGFDQEAESSVGARGLMQLTPDTYYWVRYRLGEEGSASSNQLFDPSENIKYGTANLRLLLDRFGSQETALAAYHAGWGNVSRWLEDQRYSQDGQSIHSIPFADTDCYVSKVIDTAELYRRLYEH